MKTLLPRVAPFRFTGPSMTRLMALLAAFPLILVMAGGVTGGVIGAVAWADDFKVPELTGPVVDDAGIISRPTQRAIEDALRALRDQGGSQVNVVTVPSLGGLTIEQASIRVTDEWKLGGHKTDNGVLLMIAPKERKVRIEVGQGLEGVLTDADSKRIIAEGIAPLFKAGDYDSGVLIGVYQITRKTDPTIDLSSYLEGKVSPRAKGGDSPVKLWVILLFFFLFVFLNIFRGPRIRRGPFGGWGGGGWGGGGGGFGGGGGGWSGGGGGFSGGGASGDW